MTKARPPLSLEDGITRVAGHVGWEAAAAAIGQKERTLRNYSDPDTPQVISGPDMLKLDLAYRLAGGEGAPMFEAYALQLELASLPILSCSRELSRRTAVAAKEAGEAISALIAAAQPGADRATRAIAKREAREGMDALRDTLPLLDDEVLP